MRPLFLVLAVVFIATSVSIFAEPIYDADKKQEEQEKKEDDAGNFLEVGPQEATREGRFRKAFLGGRSTESPLPGRGWPLM